MVRLAVAAFTLAWSHTVEHTRWEEDWLVGADHLHLDTARVEGSGAGMDPAPDAKLKDGMWVWHPGLDVAELSLRRAPEAGDWRLCSDGTCRAIAALLPKRADPVRIWACD